MGSGCILEIGAAGVLLHNFDAPDSVEDIHALDHLPYHRVGLIELRRIRRRDHELGAVRVRPGRLLDRHERAVLGHELRLRGRLRGVDGDEGDGALHVPRPLLLLLEPHHLVDQSVGGVSPRELGRVFDAPGQAERPDADVLDVGFGDLVEFFSPEPYSSFPGCELREPLGADGYRVAKEANHNLTRRLPVDSYVHEDFLRDRQSGGQLLCDGIGVHTWLRSDKASCH